MARAVARREPAVVRDLGPRALGALVSHMGHPTLVLPDSV